jgi:hypothetical protein
LELGRAEFSSPNINKKKFGVFELRILTLCYRIFKEMSMTIEPCTIAKHRRQQAHEIICPNVTKMQFMNHTFTVYLLSTRRFGDFKSR